MKTLVCVGGEGAPVFPTVSFQGRTQYFYFMGINADVRVRVRNPDD